MAHARRLLELKFKRQVFRKKKRAAFDQLDEAQKERIISEHRDHQKMLQLVTN